MQWQRGMAVSDWLSSVLSDRIAFGQEHDGRRSLPPLRQSYNNPISTALVRNTNHPNSFVRAPPHTFDKPPHSPLTALFIPSLNHSSTGTTIMAFDPILEPVLERNAQWAEDVEKAVPGFFTESAKGQHPKVRCTLCMHAISQCISAPSQCVTPTCNAPRRVLLARASDASNL